MCGLVQRSLAISVLQRGICAVLQPAQLAPVMVVSRTVTRPSSSCRGAQQAYNACVALVRRAVQAGRAAGRGGAVGVSAWRRRARSGISCSQITTPPQQLTHLRPAASARLRGAPPWQHSGAASTHCCLRHNRFTVYSPGLNIPALHLVEQSAHRWRRRYGYSPAAAPAAAPASVCCQSAPWRRRFLQTLLPPGFVTPAVLWCSRHSRPRMLPVWLFGVAW